MKPGFDGAGPGAGVKCCGGAGVGATVVEVPAAVWANARLSSAAKARQSG
ncbi:hypothetical protein ACFOJ6_00090 [Gordonia humi]